MIELGEVAQGAKPELYELLAAQAKSLFEDERDLIANAANLAALIYHSLPDLNWAGLYFYKDGELVLGPFQGKPACVRIPMGKGVCGKAARERVPVIVPNVNEFPDHIVCDSASNSEIVIPLVKRNLLVGVLDLDSPSLNRFDAADQAGLEELARTFLELTNT